MSQKLLAEVSQKVKDHISLSIDELALLYQQASLEELSVLANQVKARFHEENSASYLVMAIVNYTNVCVAKCDYCSFYRLPHQAGTYLLSQDEVAQKVQASVDLGATMIGFNGGFHPKLDLSHYTDMFSLLRKKFPNITFYELTVAEFMFICKKMQISYFEGAKAFYDSGTRWITGGGAEILADSFRKRHSPGKYSVKDYFAAQAAILESGIGSTATMVIGFDETLEERLSHLEALRSFQASTHDGLTSFLLWTYKPYGNELGGKEIQPDEYLRWLAICRIYLDNFLHIRTSVLTQNDNAYRGIKFGANDFDIPLEDEVTEKAGAVVDKDIAHQIARATASGFQISKRAGFPVREVRIG
jgi:cyclic dehypoxanthinyl futalosine synthase